MNVKKLMVLVGIVLWAVSGSVWAADLKIGCIDVQKLIMESSAGKEVQTSLNKEMERVQRLDAEKQKELQNLQESLDKQSPMLTPDARANRQKEYQNKAREYQRWTEDTKNEINQKGGEIQQKFSLEIKKITTKIGAEEGFTLILVKNEDLVLYSSKAIDITDRVIKALDASKK